MESQKCYFLVFYKSGKAAIILWRGKDQELLDYASSVQLFKQTKFRLTKNGLRAKGQRSQSNVNDVSKFMQQKGRMSSSGGGSMEMPDLSKIDKGMSESESPLSTTVGKLGLDLAQAKR